MSLTPVEKIKITSELNSKVKKLASINNPMEKIKLSRAIADLIERLSDEDMGADTEENPQDFGSDDPNSPNYRYRDTGYIAVVSQFESVKAAISSKDQT